MRKCYKHRLNEHKQHLQRIGLFIRVLSYVVRLGITTLDYFCQFISEREIFDRG